MVYTNNLTQLRSRMHDLDSISCLLCRKFVCRDVHDKVRPPTGANRSDRGSVQRFNEGIQFVRPVELKLEYGCVSKNENCLPSYLQFRFPSIRLCLWPFLSAKEIWQQHDVPAFFSQPINQLNGPTGFPTENIVTPDDNFRLACIRSS